MAIYSRDNEPSETIYPDPSAYTHSQKTKYSPPEREYSTLIKIVVAIVAVSIIIGIVAMNNSRKQKAMAEYQAYESAQVDQPSVEDVYYEESAVTEEATPEEVQEVPPEPVSFHDLKMISTTNETLFGDHYNKGDIESLYGETFSGYYELVCWTDGSDVQKEFTEVLTNGEYSRFTGTAFVSEIVPEDRYAEFHIYADSNLIFNTGPINKRTDPINFDVDITGARTITIEATSNDGKSNLMMTDTKPRIIAANLVVSP